MKSNVPGNRVRNLFVVVKLPVEMMFIKGKTHNEPCVWVVQFQPRQFCFFRDTFFLFITQQNTKLQRKLEVARAARYLGVVQYFRLGGVWFKAQHSLSFVKLIFNSPRIHLFMATCGRDGGINREPYKVLNPFHAGRSPTRGFFRQKL